MKNKNLGFTLVELLVVIAIIGILSSVAIINLQSAKDKATQANVQAAFSQLIPAIIVCHDDGYNLDSGAGSNTLCTGEAAADAPQANSAICTGSSTDWPDLETGWYYQFGCDSDRTVPTWSFGACEGTAEGTCTSGQRNVTCNESGCSTGFN